MIRIDYIPVWLTFFLIVGILIGYFTSPQIQWTLLSSFIFFLSGIYFYLNSDRRLQPDIAFTVSAFLLFISIGIITITVHSDSQKKYFFAKHLKTINQSVVQIDKVLKSSDFYQKFEANILQINKQKVIGKILLNIKKDCSMRVLKVDDLLLISSDIKAIRPPLNPYQFDYQNYLHKQQIDYQINLQNDEFILLKKRVKTIKGLTSLFRKKILKNLEEYNFKGQELAVINAILLGQRQDISRDLYEDYQRAGAVHILAVSGLHIGILLLLLEFLLKPLEKIKNGKVIKLVLLIILLWAFAFLAGLSASVVRAVSMFSAVAIGMFLNRSTHVKNALVISMFFLLLFHPFYLFDVGFQLSYTAVFSILVFQPGFSKILILDNTVLRYLWQILSLTLAAQIGVFPLSLFYFHQFPGLFFVSSLVIIPLLGIILGFGFITIILSSFKILPELMADTYNFIIKMLNYFVSFISGKELFLIQDVYFPMAYLWVVYLILIHLFFLVIYRKPRNIIYLFISIILLQSGMIYFRYQIQNTSELIIYNRVKSTIISFRKGKEIYTYQDKNFSGQSLKKALNREYGNIIIHPKTLKNVINTKKGQFLIIDSMAIYPVRNFRPKYVLLRNSPKINLERMLILLKPHTIIADGSNYKSHIPKWKKTCEKYRINFHSTSEKGAFILKMN